MSINFGAFLLIATLIDLQAKYGDTLGKIVQAWLPAHYATGKYGGWDELASNVGYFFVWLDFIARNYLSIFERSPRPRRTIGTNSFAKRRWTDDWLRTHARAWKKCGVDAECIFQIELSGSSATARASQRLVISCRIQRLSVS
jgi:hypothetical protein